MSGQITNTKCKEVRGVKYDNEVVEKGAFRRGKISIESRTNTKTRSGWEHSLVQWWQESWASGV